MRRGLKKDSILSMVNNNVYDGMISYNINYMFNIGSLLGLGMVVQIISGILLSLYYISLLDESYASVFYICLEVRWGYVIRYIHILGVSYIFILIYLHIYKGLYYGSYIAPRSKVWLVGVVINLLLIGIAFLGYSIVGGDQSYWGIVVICNLLTIIPYIDNWIITFIWGNYNINNDTINRLFSLHYLLGLLIIVVIISHLIYLHEYGGSNTTGISNTDSVTFHIYYTIKDIYGFYIYLLMLLILVYFYPDSTLDSDNNNKYNSMTTPVSIVPHWYLLGYYCILRSYYNKVLGVILMVLAILILGILPFTNISIIRSTRFKFINRILLNVFVCVFISLITIGGLPVNDIGVLLGKILSIYYYLYLILIIPIVGLIENILYYYRYLS